MLSKATLETEQNKMLRICSNLLELIKVFIFFPPTHCIASDLSLKVKHETLVTPWLFRAAPPGAVSTVWSPVKLGTSQVTFCSFMCSSLDPRPSTVAGSGKQKEQQENKRG